MSHRVFYFLLASVLTISAQSTTAQQKIKVPHMEDSWSQDMRPFRIAGNLYYVGTYDLGSYLITTPQGHILINTGHAESVPMIEQHIKELGFKVADIRILLTNHVHYDHVGGMAAMKKKTGAQMMVHEKDARVLGDGGASDYFFAEWGPTFAPVTADRILHNGDTIRLGNMKVVALHHPGHTMGACSFLMEVKDEKRSYTVLLANMPSVIVDTLANVKAYPSISKDYAYTFGAMKKLRFDIWLAAHASQFGLHKKHKSGDAYNPSAFLERATYDKKLADLEKAYLEKTGH